MGESVPDLGRDWASLQYQGSLTLEISRLVCHHVIFGAGSAVAQQAVLVHAFTLTAGTLVLVPECPWVYDHIYLKPISPIQLG